MVRDRTMVEMSSIVEVGSPEEDKKGIRRGYTQYIVLKYVFYGRNDRLST
jgi:hypothetical protein